MTERRKDLLALAALLAVLILYYSHILFTDKIIRAPDILNEYYWAVLEFSKRSFLDLFRFNLSAPWDIYNNSGNTLEGGDLGAQFQFLQLFIYYFISPPASVAWHIVLHLFFGACGVYVFCRIIGCGIAGSLCGGLIFALATENASLINAGHVMKIATISVTPWAFYFFERGFQSRRLIFFLTTAFVLAFQFFYTHWQIAYYTCLAIGVYGIARTICLIVEERERRGVIAVRMIGLNLALLLFFLSTVAISLVPLANWSVGTNRGAHTGANQGKGGLQVEEAMSWSLPPEELATFVIPGFFGYSRQEAGENPATISSYYWGRMNFTQTADYMGLLPWLLVPLPLLFRRDKFTWLATAAVFVGIWFSMGKYSPFYQLLYDFFPGINKFRVPKMMMFIPVMGLGVLAARGIDVLADGETRATRKFRSYILALWALPVFLLLVLAVEMMGKNYWIMQFIDMLAQPTRYEQGVQLVHQRWENLVRETWIAAGVAAIYSGAFLAYYRKLIPLKIIPVVLLALYIADTGRVNSKFMFLVNVPEKSKGIRTPVIEFLSRDSNQYRTLPMNGDPNEYSSQKIPVMFTSYPVQQLRWQRVLDVFSFNSSIPDMLNVKYLVYPSDSYAQEKGMLDPKFQPVFRSPDGNSVVLENRRVMPKAWVVPSVYVEQDVQKTLGILQSPAFDPRQVGVVETPPLLSLQPPDGQLTVPGSVRVEHYEGTPVILSATVRQNCLLVLGEKYYRGWKATVDGKPTEIVPVNHILRGIYLPPGEHRVEFRFDPSAFKIGKYLTLGSFVVFAGMLVREVLLWRRNKKRVPA